MRKFFVDEYEGQYTDPSTGEVLNYSRHKSVQMKETEPFFLTYSRHILALYNTDVLNATTKVLYKLMEFAEWNTGKVYMPKERVVEIMDVCHISKATYHRAIKELLDIGVITKGEGTFTIAENMFWKGEIRMRDKIIKSRMQVTFTPILQEDQNSGENKEA